MRFAPRTRLSRLIAGGGIILALTAATGCSAINPQSTTQSYAAADGIVATVGPVKFSNLLLVAQTADDPARVVGTVFNNTDSPVRLGFSDAESDGNLTIPAKGIIDFDQETVVLNQAGGAPGSLVPLTVSVDSDTTDLKVPVLDGTFPRYETLVPTPSPTSNAAPGEASGAGQ